MFTYSGQQVDELLCTASCNSVYLSKGHIKVTCYIFRGEVYGPDEARLSRNQLVVLLNPNQRLQLFP